MFVPFLLLTASLGALGAALLRPGLTDLVLLAAPCAIAALFLFLRALLRPRKAAEPRRLGEGEGPNWVVVDGSNVMHWKDGTPQIATVREVVDRLKSLGFSPGVVFDANAGYKISGRYRHDFAFGQLLDLPESRVMVVAKGTPADPVLLAAARDLGARVVTNDRFRDWAATHPEVLEAGRLIRGGYRQGSLWLDLG
ncbi:hypothetical protein GC209_09955 [bacterium]|nr:hypothetical protein [bacterium]